MAGDHRNSSRSGALQELASLGGRVAAFGFTPLNAAIGATLEAGVSLERRAVDRVLDSRELERIVSTALDSTRVQVALRQALDSEGARQVVDSFFDSNLYNQAIERLADQRCVVAAHR